MDEMISSAVETCFEKYGSAANTKEMADIINKEVNNPLTRVRLLMNIRQLKQAYILAVKHNFVNEVYQMLQLARTNGNQTVEKLCERKLEQDALSCPLANNLLALYNDSKR